MFISCKKEDAASCASCVELNSARGGGRGKTKPIETTSSTYAILLDFDGHNVNSPSWNGGVPFYAEPAAPFDTSFVFKMVRSKFKNFRILMTSSESEWSTATYKVRCIITSTEFYGGVSGVAYVGSLKANTDFFVFPDLLYNIPDRIGNAIAHETGHSIGLYHQALWDANCNLLSSYNNGTWEGAPIMGNPAGKPSYWWVGPTPYGCNDIQNDSLKMASVLK